MFKLHDYQTRLVDQARKELTQHQGVLVVSPAGSGKSVIIAEIARLTTLNKNHVLFIVHRQELAEQIEETFVENDVDMSYVTIMTVLKVVNRLDMLPTPHLIITDETHHSRANSYRKVYDYYSDAYRLGFTASPWRLNGKGFNDIYGAMVEGPEVQWLINHRFLAPFRYFAPKLADLSKLKTSSTGDYSKQSMDKAMGNVIFGDVVKHYKKLANGKQAILYAHSITASKDLAKTFQKAGLNAEHVDSNTPIDDRKQIMSDFKKGELKIICNVDLISEGFNVPDCQCVIMVRPTASLVLHIQQSMRCMRYKPGKEAIIIDHVGNYEEHGLPSDEREWTLGDRESKVGSYNGKRSSTTECPNCFAVIPNTNQLCPICGSELKTENNDMEQIDAELSEINQKTFKTDYTAVRIKKEYQNRKMDDLETIDDFYLYARTRNYKLAWVKFNMPYLSRLSWPEFYQKIKPIEQKYEGVF